VVGRIAEAITMFETLIIFLAIGAMGGLVAGFVEDGHGPGLGGNILAGLVGSCAGGWLFNHFRQMHGGGVPGDLIGATAGGIILLFLFRLSPRAVWLKAPAARSFPH
jgi:uncharacterized membrane protein YeaQ/YmgE (transglycosylase-associated protein family)